MARKKLTKRQRKIRNRWLIFAALALLIFVLGYHIGQQQSSGQNFSDYATEKVTDIRKWFEQLFEPADDIGQSEMPVQVHVFDVGQGSSMLLQGNDGTNILIDAGRHDEASKQLLSSLDKYIGTGGKIDLLILTHNDSDHIGLADEIVTYYQVGQVWMNGLDADSNVYLRTLEAIDKADVAYYEPKAGEQVEVGPFAIEVLHPDADSQSNNQNSESIVTRIAANGVVFMQSGDAGMADEKAILEQFSNVSANVLVLGHHGSNTSSSREWIEAVNPDLAIYSAGVGNSYGHPSPETVQTIESLGIPLYGTDRDGSVHIYSDEYGTFRYEIDGKEE